MDTRVRLLALSLAIAGALLGATGLFSGVIWLSACGVVMLAGATAVAVAWHPEEPPSGTSHGAPLPSQPATDSVAGDADAVLATPSAEPESRRPTRPHTRPLTVSAPLSAEPTDVVAALAQNSALAGEVLAAHLWLEDSPSATLRLVAGWGPKRPDGTPIDIQSTTLGRALASGSPTLRPEHDVNDESPAIWRYAIPIESGDARGVAAVDVAGAKPDGRVLGDAAADLGPSLTAALSIHIAHQESSAARVLLEAARDLSRLADPESVAQALLDRAVDLGRADTGSVMLTDADGVLRIVAAKGLPHDVVERTHVTEGEGVAGWVLASGKPLVVEDLNGRTPRSRRHGVRTAVTVPIVDDDSVLGVLNVGAREFTARFSRTHVDALESLGRIGAVALRNSEATQSSRDLYFDTLRALAVALETRDPYSRGSTERVLDLATSLGQRANLNQRDLRALRVASLLHDVGMSAVGDAAAIGDRPLSTVEWGLLKMHPVIAADVIAQAPALHDAVPIVYHHHEHFDGAGYVGGIAGDQIPMGARILAVADAYAALTSDRPYRHACSEEEALREIESFSGTQFDPQIVTMLSDVVGQTTAAPSV